MSISFTKPQSEAINVKNGDILVSAAAGGGKTAVLTERAIRLLTGENPVPADRLLIVTFTVSAAEEMKNRIHQKLSVLISKNPTDSNLRYQQMLIKNAKISSIDSFCSSLVKVNFQKLGLPHDMKIAEETQIAVIKDEAFKEALEEFYKDESESFLSLVEFMSVKNDKPLYEAVSDIYNFIRSFAFPMDYLSSVEKMYESPQTLNNNPWIDYAKPLIIDALCYFISKMEGCAVDIKSDQQVADSYLEAFEGDITQYENIRLAVEEDDIELAMKLSAGFDKRRLSPVKKYDDQDFLDYLKSTRKAVHDDFSKLVSELLCYSEADFQADRKLLSAHIKTLFAVVRRAYLLIEEKKLSQAILDYSDLEYYTLKLLAEQTESGCVKTALGKSISSEYDYIMVDECQDINDIQNTIFTMLSNDCKNLYMVGDIKQSIYRFRKAMPSLFIEKKKSFALYDEETHTDDTHAMITLDSNFRSRKSVCDFVNFLFSRIMTEKAGEIDYKNGEALVAASLYPDKDDDMAEIHILDYQKDDEDEKIEAEAKYVTSLIEKMISEKYEVTEKDGKQRPCKYNDFTILLRAAKGGKADAYAKALIDRGIPCFCDTSDGYFNEYEITLILNLLRIIDNPLLDVPLLSVLMSPVFAFSADKIAEIRLAKRYSPLYVALSELACAGDKQCADFISMLSDLRQRSVLMKISEIITLILDSTDFCSVAYAMGDGEQKNANLRLLLNYAKRYEEFSSNGLSGFMRYIDKIIEAKSDFSCANVKSDTKNAVNIMSIHSSKGLEFPICILADTAKGFNRMDLNRRLLMNSDLGVSLKIQDIENLKSYSNLQREAIKLKNKKESIAEEMRVLYVALTRAKEKLIMVMTYENAEQKIKNIADRTTLDSENAYPVLHSGSYAEWIISAALSHPQAFDLRKLADRTQIQIAPAYFKLKIVTAKGVESCEKAEEIEISHNALPDEKAVKEILSNFAFSYKDIELTKIPTKLAVTEIVKKQAGNSLSLSEKPDFMFDGGFTPSERGTILHSFMQYADYENAKADLEGEIARLVSEKFISEEQANELNQDKIKAFFSSDLYERMVKASEVKREFKFFYFVSPKEIFPEAVNFKEEKILVQGIADCIIFEEDGITIVDYKTDYVKDGEELISRYFNQLKIYKDAISEMFDMPVKQCLIFSLNLEREFEIPC